jgi:GMP synthase-like glutamine amidotransferase
MFEIAVIQNFGSDGVGFFGEYAAQQGWPLRIFHAYAGDELPRDLKSFAGLCILGGPMSVNDDLPALRQTEQLIREAVSDDIPVIGHCLGGQLLSKTYGGSISSAPQPEIGWVEITSLGVSEGNNSNNSNNSPGNDGLAWFGAAQFQIFHWHNETFSLPSGAQHLATSPWCENQAFVLGKMHLGLQFHCEITQQKIDDWLNETACQQEMQRLAPLHGGVQNEAQLRATTNDYLPSSIATAHHIYRRWGQYLKRG